MNIQEDYVSFETAKLLKEKGFNEKLITYYLAAEDKKESYFQIMAFTDDTVDNNRSVYCYLAPTLQMTMKWLREVHKIHITIGYAYKADANLTDDYVSYCFETENAKTLISYTQNEWYDTYEQACEAAIKYCLENLV